MHTSYDARLPADALCTVGSGVCYTPHMPYLKKVAGVLLIILGFLALVTPLTPGAWLMFVGLELIGVRLAAWDKVKEWIAARRGATRSDTPPTDKSTR